MALPAEEQFKSVHLGTSYVSVIYPQALDAWFAGLVEPFKGSSVSSKFVRLCFDSETDRYSLASSSGPTSENLDLGEALAILWERISFLLIDELTAAIVFHAAAMRRGNDVILIPGQSGSGKTHLSLWYRNSGFDLGTDEIVSVAPAHGEGCDTVFSSTFARPLMLKRSADVMALPGLQELPLHLAFSGGSILMTDDSKAWSGVRLHRGFLVFPHFAPDAPFCMTALTAGEACLHLMENCLNARNLPNGGLPLAGRLARQSQAISLTYSDLRQLDGTLDVLTRQVLATPVTHSDLVALCDAFNATVTARVAPAREIGIAARKALKQNAPAPTVRRFPRRLTFGMATYDDYDGAYFTIQSLRMNNPELAGALEFVVIDNNPGGPCSEALSNLAKSIDGYRYVPKGEWNGTAIKNAVFEEASSPFVLCVDSHVLIAPGAVARLIAYFEADPDTPDLLQGPLVADDLSLRASHMESRWRDGMYGVWATDPRATNPEGPVFDIPMQGMGLFACRRTAWAGFNPSFRGFGGEEGYIHEKTRQRGGRTLCLPFLRWLHRFARPLGAPYPNRWEDRARNYVLGFREIGWDTGEIETHFAERLGAEFAARLFAGINSELAETGRETALGKQRTGLPVD